jgi:endonuclease/exonuclease/phosphatase family metal-dependent hydrolase
MVNNIGILILILFFVACQRPEQPKQAESKATKSEQVNQEITFDDDDICVATLNIAWLGDGKNDRLDREEEDYKNIANVISQVEADFIALQEIENDEAIKRVLAYLPQYDYFIDDSGSQNVGIIFSKELEVEVLDIYTPLLTGNKRLRPGLWARVKKGNFDFYAMVVHFKSTSRFDEGEEGKERSRGIRKKQAEIINKWADSLLTNGKEQDLIILGDFNDSPLKKRYNTLNRINSKKLEFITADLQSCKFEKLKGIDHLLVTASAKQRLIPKSIGIYNLHKAYKKNIAAQISDHCPVFARFDIKKEDND